MMYRSLLMYLIVWISPLILILLANTRDPHNGLLLTIGLGFVTSAAGIGVLWHHRSSGGYLQTLFFSVDFSRAAARKDATVIMRGIEFGDFADNLEALVLLLRRLASGEVVESYMGLYRLREHIILKGDAKSSAWLLPAIDGAIGRGR